MLIQYLIYEPHDLEHCEHVLKIPIISTLRTNLRLFFPTLSHPMISFSSLNCLPYFQKLRFAFFCIFLIFWESFGSEKRVIKENATLNLFTCADQVFINNYPGSCIPKLDAGSLIGIRSHLEMHDYISHKKELVGDNA